MWGSNSTTWTTAARAAPGLLLALLVLVAVATMVGARAPEGSEVSAAPTDPGSYSLATPADLGAPATVDAERARAVSPRGRRIVAASVSLLAALVALLALRQGRYHSPTPSREEEGGAAGRTPEEEEAGLIQEPLDPEPAGWECEDDTFVQVPSPPEDLAGTSAGEAAPVPEPEEAVALAHDPCDLPEPESQDTEKPVMEPAEVGAPASLCALLLAEGRLEEAEGLARSQLGDGPEMVVILRQVARVAQLVGETEQALEFALRAFQAGRDREDFAHLVRLTALERRFVREDRHRLRSAVVAHPEEPVLLYAAGVWEAMYGDRPRSQRLLRAALRHEPDEELRGAIARELDRLA